MILGEEQRVSAGVAAVAKSVPLVSKKSMRKKVASACDGILSFVRPYTRCDLKND